MSARLLNSVSALAFLGAMLVLVTPAGASVKKVKSQTVYVPAYSHIYHGDREIPFYLTVTLSIRNTDATQPIRILSVGYFDTEGKLIKQYVEGVVLVPPMGAVRYVVKESDKSGGSGANFLVKWKAEVGVTEPIVETVMISTATQQGISFTSRGQAVEEEGL
ncbi:MAG: DUF3124 domain-containing protein [Syntrophobacteraceae bacterium]